MMKKPSGSKPLGRVLPSMVEDQGWAKQLDLHAIFPRWPDLVGPEIRDHARPLKIDREVLWLEVENSSWLSQLQYSKLEILDAVNKILRLGRIRDVRMILPKKTEKNPYYEGPPPGPVIRYETPPSEEVERFQLQAETIKDDACREALVQFWYLATACKRDEK
jgi:hypothetical protein